MSNSNLSTSLYSARISAVNYASTTKNPILSRLGVIPVVAFDASMYLLENPLNAWQNLGWTIKEIIDCFCFIQPSTTDVIKYAEETAVSVTNSAANAVTIIPFAVYHAAKGLWNPKNLTPIYKESEAGEAIETLASNLEDRVEDPFQKMFKRKFSGNSICLSILKRPASALCVTVDRIAKIAAFAFCALGRVIECASALTIGLYRGDSLEQAIIHLTIGLQFAGICASKIALTPIYLINQWAINLLMPPTKGYSA